MVRRHLVKACNDIMCGPAQNNVKYSSVSEGQGGGLPRTGVKSSMSPEEYRKQKTQNLVFPRRDGEEKKRNLFIDIDGKDNLSVEEDETKPTPTAHTMQSYFSLADLSRNRGWTEGPLGKTFPQPVGRTKAEQDAMFRHSKARQNANDTAATGERKMELPWGFRGSDKPYVLPKFMPTFREMASVKKERPRLVALTESTPPSMQKWAVEWNAEPNKINIEELKEDLNREIVSMRQNGSPPEIVNDFLPQTQGSKSTPQESSAGTLAKDHTADTQAEGVEKKASPPKILSAVDGDVVIPEEAPNSQREWQTMRSSINWLQEKMTEVRRKPDQVPRKWDQFSFKETLTKNEHGSNKSIDDSTAYHSHDKQVVLDDEKRKFHEWFKIRLSKATYMANASPPGMKLEEVRARDEHLENEQTQHKGQTDKNELNKQGERNEKTHTAESNSSFSLWMRQRRRNHSARPRQVTKVQARLQTKVGSGTKLSPSNHFPWSASYTNKFTPGKTSRNYVNKIVASKSSLKIIKKPSRSLLNRSSNKRITSPKKDSSAEIKNEKVSERAALYGYGVDNEMDHVNNVRQGEHKLSSPKSSRRSWARDHPLCYWESKLGFRTSVMKEDHKWNGQRPKRRNTWGGKTRSGKTKIPYSFVNISEETEFPGSLQSGREDEWPDLRSFEARVNDTLTEKNPRVGEGQPSVRVRNSESNDSTQIRPTLLARRPELVEKSEAVEALKSSDVKDSNDVTTDLPPLPRDSLSNIHSSIEADFDHLSAEEDEDWLAFVGPRRNHFQDNDLVMVFGRNSFPTQATMLQ